MSQTERMAEASIGRWYARDRLIDAVLRVEPKALTGDVSAGFRACRSCFRFDRRGAWRI